MKQNCLDKLRAQLADTSKMGPRSILPVANLVNIPVTVPSVAVSASSSTDVAASLKVIQPSPSVTTCSQKKLPPGTICLDAEEGVKEDPSADLRRKRQKRKHDDVSVTDRVPEEDSAWEHDVHPVDLAFPDKFDYRKAIDGRVASSSVRRALVKMPPEQLLRESYRFTTKALACFQISVLTAERDSALAYLPLKEEVDTLKDQLSEREGERQSALDRVNQLEEDVKVLNTQLASRRFSLEKEQKKVEVDEKDISALNASLVEKQAALGTANASAEFWEAEWKKLGDETLDMCQETLETVLDQFSHLCPGVDFSAITLDTRWDPKSRRIVNRKKASDEDLEMVDDPPHVDAVSQEQQPERPEQVQQSEPGSVVGEGGECPT
ncbi:hypothetical protein PIB30_020762 [Stylosanthes scabra]|uniref:Uncharacterized protein n=1 Tax=Stylosanthes scabra TaxID=79078 RepID=A0ABU6Q920_9FABA|nr:hypothetical protein [Stylosanthes scabra]